MKTSKQVSKTLILSAAAALAFGGVAVGTTYALFTSKTNGQIEVASGKVSVTSKIEVKEVYSPSLINPGDATIFDSTNNADYADIKAEVSEDGNSVSITKMLPGDKVTLTVTPKNNSNVKIKYRETYSFTGDNTGALKVTGDDAMVKNWTALDAEGEIEAYEIVVELPATATEEIEQATIKLGVEAVQGNAVVYDTEVASEEDLLEALSSSSESVSVKATSDIELSEPIRVSARNLTIYGDGDTKITTTEKRVFNINEPDPTDSDDADVYGKFTHENGSLTLVGIDLSSATSTLPADSSESVRTINVWGTTNFTLTLDNCNVSTTHYPLNIASNNENLNLIVRNSTLKGYGGVNIWSPNTTGLFENCELIGENYWSGNGNNFFAIALTDDTDNSKLTFKDCTISAKENGSATEGFLTIQKKSRGTKIGTNIEVEFDGCTFKHNDTEIKKEDDETMGDYIKKVSNYINDQGVNNTITIK